MLTESISEETIVEKELEIPHHCFLYTAMENRATLADFGLALWFRELIHPARLNGGPREAMVLRLLQGPYLLEGESHSKFFCQAGLYIVENLD